MEHSTRPYPPDAARCDDRSGRRLLADGGREDEGEDAAGSEEESGVDRSSVEVTDAGEAEPADPKWEKPDVEDIPEVEGPKTRPAETDDADGPTTGHGGAGNSDPAGTDPTAGMPNTARSPGRSRLKETGADGYVVALELCARLPDEVRLPEEAADLVPVALEAELEQDVQSFAAEEFDNPSPHVETLDFVDVDGELWLRLRLGVPPEAFADLDPAEIRDHALQQIDGLV